VPLYKEGGSFKNSDGAKPMCKVVESERLPGLGFNDIHCWPWTMIRESPQVTMIFYMMFFQIEI
jgi:hypothetical protein